VQVLSRKKNIILVALLKVENAWPTRDKDIFHPEHKGQREVEKKKDTSRSKGGIDEENTQFGDRYAEFRAHSGEYAKPLCFHFIS